MAEKKQEESTDMNIRRRKNILPLPKTFLDHETEK